ncbi:hypothetical protein [Chryseobacterium sp.]|uniref:hypothetical protein n=1 Tax=Chryseobacterium sp. TaxID=1871047 RepID=UPI00289CD576|nr:hypothetical protein [Chryseobacterium sp.]
MKKIISITNSKKLQSTLLFLMIFCANHSFSGQQNHVHYSWEKDLHIAYNTPFSYTLSQGINWQIQNSQDKIIKTGKGNISDFIFTIPGNYEVDIKTNENSEEQGNIPNKLHINVSAYKMEFIIPSVKMSNIIVGGKSTQPILLKADVKFSSYDGNPVVFDKDITCSGVDCTIIGKLKNGPVTLKQGINTLEFQLQGKAHPDSYISFHLININDEIQPYDISYQIK